MGVGRSAVGITKGRQVMLAVSGSFSGGIRTQSVISLDDQPNHSLGIAEVSGTQSSSDAKWNNSAITYWGTTDMQGTQGTQRGYFLNDHGSAGQDRGTFEGNVSVVAGEVAVEGKWQYTGGAGDFAGITGNGTFKTRLTSPTTVEGSWQGTYELAGAAAV
jgi:hypothetical protein